VLVAIIRKSTDIYGNSLNHRANEPKELEFALFIWRM